MGVRTTTVPATVHHRLRPWTFEGPKTWTDYRGLVRKLEELRRLRQGMGLGTAAEVVGIAVRWVIG